MQSAQPRDVGALTLVIGLFLVVDILITYVLEPMLYGHSIGVTTSFTFSNRGAISALSSGVQV